MLLTQALQEKLPTTHSPPTLLQKFLLFYSFPDFNSHLNQSCQVSKTKRKEERGLHQRQFLQKAQELCSFLKKDPIFHSPRPVIQHCFGSLLMVWYSSFFQLALSLGQIRQELHGVLKIWHTEMLHNLQVEEIQGEGRDENQKPIEVFLSNLPVLFTYTSERGQVFSSWAYYLVTYQAKTTLGRGTM